MNHNKVIFLGESGVGKTSIIVRRRYGKFNYGMAPTIGVGYEQIDEQFDGHIVQLYLWDTAGQEQFNSVVPYYCREARVAVIVASLTDASSIKELDKWNRLCDESNDHPFVIVAINKIDIAPEETLNSVRDQIQEKFNTFFFVSAKSGNGIDELFSSIAQYIYLRNISTEEHPDVAYAVRISEQTNEDENQRRECC